LIGPTVNPGIAGRGKTAGSPGVLAVTDSVYEPGAKVGLAAIRIPEFVLTVAVNPVGELVVALTVTAPVPASAPRLSGIVVDCPGQICSEVGSPNCACETVGASKPKNSIAR
jgi:hypothetical protein